ncbi:DUF3718 domain-containing protein [Shewanella sp. VB17]|uniref:DUF3718 domain-containing protein n=1 Tax=Shewanella sp. VB17 TaxID=2739432 RepID=UPI001563EA53|nr:DUF3718 domain-containing protein [Shewanella sp. VB17]NRD73158.1 DUF3718 domain-containing protein [Shewanella sp. VB17]
MKKPLIIATLIFTPLVFNTSEAMDSDIEKALVNVCKAGASNSMHKLHNTVKHYRINERRIYPRLVCNGETFHQFTVNHGADKTAKYISRYTKGNVKIKDIATIYSSDKLLAINN